MVSCSRPRKHWVSLQTEVSYQRGSGRDSPPLSCPHGRGLVTHVSSVSRRAWLRPVASLGTCSGPKLHSLSLRAEGKGQSLGEACWDCQDPRGSLH